MLQSWVATEYPTMVWTKEHDREYKRRSRAAARKAQLMDMHNATCSTLLQIKKSAMMRNDIDTLNAVEQEVWNRINSKVPNPTRGAVKWIRLGDTVLRED